MFVLHDWRRLAWWPALAFIAAFAVLEIGQLDRPIALALFYHPGTGWLGTGAGDWWARGVFHQAGRWLPRSVATLALVGWLASFGVAALESWRRELLYVFLGMAAVTLSVGALKELTNVDCPWDLAGFGGLNPYIPLFADRPDGLKHAACFPGAHASSGFALLAVHFALRDRCARAARITFWAAILVGILFAIGQEARGAHFLSHDLTSAGLAWLLLAWLYSKLLYARVTTPSEIQTRE